MTINKNNYEAFFLDYHEKSLSPEQVAELLLFLEHHPELQKEFDAFSIISLTEGDKIVFDNKETLKKNIITPASFNDFAVANLEGDLTADDKKQYENFIASNPDYKKADQLFSQTKLKADLSVVLPNKKDLKKNRTTIISLNSFYLVAIAASVLIVLGLFFSKESVHVDKSQTAEQVKPAVKEPAIENEHKYAAQPAVNNTVINTVIGPSKKAINKPDNQLASVSELKKEKQQYGLIQKREMINLIETHSTMLTHELPALRLKSLQTFPVYLLDENYAVVEPLERTPAFVFENMKKDVIKKIEKSEQDNDENWFPENAFDPKKKTRLIDVLASAINKISGKKVHLQPEYNNKGEMVSYDFSAGAFSFKKDLSK